MQTKVNERIVLEDNSNSILKNSILSDCVTECNDLKVMADEYKKNNEQCNERI